MDKTKRNPTMNKKSVKNKVNPYSLRCEGGFVAEVAKGVFIGTDEYGEFTLKDDLCDGYIGVRGELDEAIEEYWIQEGQHKGYPKLHKVRKEITICGCYKMVDNKWVKEW